MGYIPHVSVCICTFRRPHLLKALLGDLDQQQTDDRFTYSVVVVDNDDLQTGEGTVLEFAAVSRIHITYCVESRQNISLARNKAIANSRGDFLAFIDDDEFPSERWLATLLEACNKYHSDGVLGPVMPYFDKNVPNWIIKGKFFDRPTHATGFRLSSGQTRTGNVLIKAAILSGETQHFDPEFLVAHDQVFFKKLMNMGYAFIWCNEAPVYELVPEARWKPSFLLRRALFRGANGTREKPVRRFLLSCVATPVYVCLLLLGLLRGQAEFMRYAFKLCYHVGRLLRVAGINPVKTTYVSE